MARTNEVWLLGRIESIDIQSGCRSGRILLHTIRRQSCDAYLRPEGKERWDEPVIFTKDRTFIRERMAGLHRGDVVFVKGVFVTRDINRRYFCRTCGDYRTVDGCVSVYVRPLDILMAESGMSQEEEELPPDEKEGMSGRRMLPHEAYAFVRQHQESSNTVLIAGTVCVEPDPADDYYERGSRFRTFVFRLASNRIFRVPEDGAGKSTDYPVIRCYGELAERACRMVRRGTEVFISGVIQTRRIRHSAVCPVCGRLMERDGIAMEIVPRNLICLRNQEGEEDGNDPETSEALLLGRAVRVDDPKTAGKENSAKSGFLLQTVRRAAFGAGIRNRMTEIWDLPYVYSKDLCLAEQIQSVRTGDLVLVRALVSARRRNIRIRCPSCGREIPDVRRNSLYLVPLDILKIRGGTPPAKEGIREETLETPKMQGMAEAVNSIRFHREISNQAVAEGRVKQEPSEAEIVRHRDEQDTEFVFYLAHDRGYRTGREGEETFRVRCFGKMAEEAFPSIHENSLVLINGAVQARWGTNRAVCPFCGKTAEWKDTMTELVPYHIEYLKDCDLPGREG